MDTTEPDRFEIRPPAPLPETAHKGLAGRVLCVAGSEEMPGAAVLVVRSAQRGGAGLVILVCLDEALMRIVPAAAPEAVLLDLRAGANDAVAEAGVALRLIPARAPDALVLGPGLGTRAGTKIAVAYGLGFAPGVPRILDADALNVLAEDPGLLRACRGPLVMTPHPGEAARLLQRDVPTDGPGRIAAAREIVERSREAAGIGERTREAAGIGDLEVICCLKGKGTVVTDGRRVHVNRTGNSGMATAGSGDVLAGLLGAAVARSARVSSEGGEAWTLWEAALWSVHVHGLAGDLAVEHYGRNALIASDLIEFLPAAQRSVEEGGV